MVHMTLLYLYLHAHPYHISQSEELRANLYNNGLSFVEEILQATTHPLDDNKAAPMLDTKFFHLDLLFKALSGVRASYLSSVIIKYTDKII